MTEKEIQDEADGEKDKDAEELIKDTIREANQIPQNTASEKENLDIIKHLIKRLAIHQIVLEDRANGINSWLIILSAIMAIGAFFSILSYFK